MVEDDVAYIANIGDSRFYRLHEHLEQITVDHSLVEEMVQSGEIQRKKMRTHPNKKYYYKSAWGRMIPSDRIVLR